MRHVTDGRLRTAAAAIDAANAADPNAVVVGEEEQPLARHQGRRAVAWLEQLAPDASEELMLAARGHHVRRWERPRSDYPAGRSGYLRWRRDAKAHHATVLRDIMADAGYDEASADRVADIVAKKGLGSDPEVQAFEDAVCLVFVETQYDELAARTPDDKMSSILEKTLRKMSEPAIELAVALRPSLAGE